MNPNCAALDARIDAHFDTEVQFLQALVRVPTDTPPGNNAPQAERTAELLAAMGLPAAKFPVPDWALKECGLQSIVNLIVRRRFADGKLYGRAAAVNKSDFATFTFALRALQALGAKLMGGVELHFTYDEEFGGKPAPAGC